ncbi:hypothetical protein D9Q98_009897 [Chlorella vulgaris]|uniref:STI1 domain-containing protein n=1 Tax=Chlorella vulgaris TaxID=3077 RepID=A0A9D4YSQ9_CHLVU|nr:hypothetical protein D9Q98_009897 [Chlorella vulgaris]
MQAIVASSGLLGLPARRPHHRAVRLARLTPVASRRGEAATPPPTPPPVQAPEAPQDIPTYFQAAPEPQVYQAVPQYSSLPQPPAPKAALPPLVYIGIGVVLATVLSKVLGFLKGGPQKVQEMAMQQMMKQMMKQMGSAQGGASPFGAAGGANPFGAAGGANPFGAGANPFGGAGGANPFGAGANPFGAPPASSGFPSNNAPAFDTTATPAAAAAPPSAAAPSSSSSTAAAAAGDTAAGSTSASKGEAKEKKRSAFTDVNAGSASNGTAASGASTSASSDGSSNGSATSAGSAPPPPPFSMPPPSFGMPPPPGAAGGGGTAGGTASSGMTATMLDMLKDPEMQKMFYPHLPEPMRNPETFEWMLNTPELRAQLEGMLQQQAASTGSPAVMEMMQNMPQMTKEQMEANLSSVGLTSDQFMAKVMSDPDLAGLMTNPKVMAAIAETTKNPMAIFNYQNDPEVMRVFEKFQEMFGAGGPGGGMPPGFGGPPSQ